MSIQFGSKDIEHQASIPKDFSCEGDNISPHLEWKSTPSYTKSLVIILDDPDSSAGIWTHWVVYNIPADRSELPRGVSDEELQSWGGSHGKNDFGNSYYQGPCPPQGTTHRYVLRLYAIDKVLSLNPGATREEVLDRIQGHIVDEAELIGRFTRE